MPSSGDTLRFSNVQLPSLGNYTVTGTNFHWDFSGLIHTSQGIRDFKSALQTPYAFFFFGFNEFGEKIADTLGAGPVVFTNYYNYYKKQISPAAWVADGAGITFSSVPVPNYYSDKDELYMFPLSYPKYDSTSFKFSTASNTMVPVKYSKTGYRVTSVDGWGTITTPFGTANCLRVVTTQYSKDSIKNTFVPIPLGFVNNQRSYQWLTAGSKIPFLEINGNLTQNGFTATNARFRDAPRSPAGVAEHESGMQIAIFPNPANEVICLSVSLPENTVISILNAEGKLVLEKAVIYSFNGLTVIEINTLPAGVYSLFIEGIAAPEGLKFIKQ